jgi:hypothetical protein
MQPPARSNERGSRSFKKLFTLKKPFTLAAFYFIIYPAFRHPKTQILAEVSVC